MQKQNLLKERNGASSKPETHTPSSALDIPVVVIDGMTPFETKVISILRRHCFGVNPLSDTGVPFGTSQPCLFKPFT